MASAAGPPIHTPKWSAIADERSLWRQVASQAQYIHETKNDGDDDRVSDFHIPIFYEPIRDSWYLIIEHVNWHPGAWHCVFFLVSKQRKWRDFEQLNIGILKVFLTYPRFQRFRSFSNFHCKNTHIDMGIPKIPACRGISLASNCTFRIYEFKNVVDKITSGSMPLFSFYF